jgi:AcrR family transcriptional regulator
MPYTAQHKLETRQKILESARRMFNLKGFAEVSIEAVMENAGLTHGGFYRHFSGKDELYAEAVRWFLCPEAPKPWQRQARRDGADKPRARRIVDAYFSRDHFNDRETCCPLIGLPSEVSHASDLVKAAYQDVLRQLVDLLQADLKGRDSRERALTLVTLCIGGMVAARNVGDAKLAHELRESAYRQAQTVLEGGSC